MEKQTQMPSYIILRLLNIFFLRRRGGEPLSSRPRKYVFVRFTPLPPSLKQFLDTCLYSVHVPIFHISHSSFTMILGVCFLLSFQIVVLVREVSCVGYTHRAWGSRFLWSMLNGSLYFFFATSSQRLKTALSLVYNNNNNAGS